MPAYLIVDSTVTDPDGMTDYRARVGATYAKYGGKRVLRSRRLATLEGDWSPNGITMLEFESADKALEWYNSPEYGELKDLRHRSATSKLILVEEM